MLYSLVPCSSQCPSTMMLVEVLAFSQLALSCMVGTASLRILYLSKSKWMRFKEAVVSVFTSPEVEAPCLEQAAEAMRIQAKPKAMMNVFLELIGTPSF